MILARPFELEILSDELIGAEGGFLAVRRLHLRNVRADGSRSAEWIYDYIVRKKGLDAVVLLLWRRAPSGTAPGAIEVLLRDGLRPALIWGRPAEQHALPDARTHFLLTELVAGIIEAGEHGEAAVRRRAADEAFEEAGIRVAPESLALLGTGYPSPGMTPEKFVFTAAEVSAGAVLHPPAGDGSPMEEGATIRWVDLDRAIAMCRDGEIEDLKTEIALRRFKEWLAGIGVGVLR